MFQSFVHQAIAQTFKSLNVFRKLFLQCTPVWMLSYVTRTFPKSTDNKKIKASLNFNSVEALLTA